MTDEYCPTCGKGKLVEDTRNVTYSYYGKKIDIRNVHACFCTECEEFVMDDTESQRVSNELKTFREQCQLQDSTFIRNVRKKLCLGQKEACELFGGGVNAFSRYETGKAKPSLALVKLFRILDAHPELISLVR